MHTARHPHQSTPMRIAIAVAALTVAGGGLLAAAPDGAPDDRSAAVATTVVPATASPDASDAIPTAEGATAASGAAPTESHRTEPDPTASVGGADEPATTAVLPATAPSAPADDGFVDEEPAPGAPGVVDGDEPPADPQPPSPPAMAPAQLAPVPVPVPDPPDPPTVPAIDLTAPTTPPEPPLPPDPDPDPAAVGGFAVAPPPPVIDDLAGNETGCAVDCVERALLRPSALTADLGLDVATTVAARIDVALTDENSGEELLFTSGGFQRSWSAQLSPLAAHTPYHLVLTVTDHDGQHQIYTHDLVTRTPIEGPDQFTAGTGCAIQCITQGVAEPTDVFSTVRLRVKTSTPAAMTAWVSTSEAGWVGDAPLMPAEAKVGGPTNPSTSWSFDITGLAGDTTYHVVVRAEDADGHAAYRLGEFHTAAAPVRVESRFELIFVKWDGDPLWGGLDRGELSFAWGADGHTLGTRGEEKMDGGTTVTIREFNSMVSHLAPGEHLPTLMVSATERDAHVFSFCSHGDGVTPEPTEVKDCGWKINAATLPGLTVDDIASMPLCSDYGITGEAASRRCGSMTSPWHGKDYPEFQAIVSFAVG